MIPSVKNDSIILMNFTGIYEQEHFYQNMNTSWIDCKDVPGTYGYCDEEAIICLKKKIEPFTPYGIHFIDSGNYHYMSKLWTDKIHVSFSLCLFDHHPDMQPSCFENLLSCGDWVKEALDQNPFLKKVILIGISDDLASSIDTSYKDRIILFNETSLKQKDCWYQFATQSLAEPVYLSIDKDVLSPECAVSDWDQGSLTLDELKRILYMIIEKEVVLGADICGECTHHLSHLTAKETLLNESSNYELLHFLLDLKANIHP